MAVGLKFWHGDLVATKLYPLTNTYTQDKGASDGICTAASLAWCKACLALNRPPNSWAEVGASDHNLNIAMRTMRQMDDNPAAQTELAGLSIVGGDRTVTSFKEVMMLIEASATKLGIFWTSYHTMAYRYAHHQKDFFDMNTGAYRSKYVKAIEAKVNQDYPHEIIGCRIVGPD